MTYYSLNQYLKDTFGCKVYKLALDAGLTCPNRDGTIDTRGCIFCSGGGSGEFAEHISPGNITEQINAAKQRVFTKNKDGKYIAYFQAFTNTYGPIDYLERIFTEAIQINDIVALSIATRPDCLSNEVLSLLKKLNKIKPVWVELGLQTIHERTAEYIRRGYTLSVFDEAVHNLRAIGIEVIVHTILGLPGETKEQMLETVRYVGKKDVQGIKLQLLHVLEGTDLANDYKEGKFDTMTLDDYIEIIPHCLSQLPPEIVIHRITGDGNRKTLIAPKWSLDKKRVLNLLNKAIQNYNL